MSAYPVSIGYRFYKSEGNFDDTQKHVKEEKNTIFNVNMDKGVFV